MTKAVFLDRDGTLNVDPGYVHRPQDLSLYPEVPEALQELQAKGYLLIVVTNQSGISRNFFTEQDLHQFHKAMETELAKHDVQLNAIYFCPHTPEEECPCRKPHTLLVERAIEEFQIEASQSYFVGDRESDILCGVAMGLKTFLVTHEPGGSLLDFVRTLP